MASILGKSPFVDKILSSCSSEQLSTLASLVNNPGSATTVYLYGNDRLLSESNKGVSYVQLMIDEYSRRYLNGFLVYIDNSNCGFFSFTGNSSHIVEISINPTSLAYVDIYENLTAEEFRRTLADMAGGGGSAADKAYINGMFFAPYNEDLAYTEQFIVSKGDKIYSCLVDMDEPEEWNPEHWSDISDRFASENSYVYGTSLYSVCSFPITFNSFLSPTHTTISKDKILISGNDLGGGWKQSVEIKPNSLTVDGAGSGKIEIDGSGIKVTAANQNLDWVTFYIKFPVLDNNSEATFAVDNQTTSSFIPSVSLVGNATTNFNGLWLGKGGETGLGFNYLFGAELVTVGGYTCWRINYDNGGLGQERARFYMRCMTGSNFLPTYDYNNPKTVLFMFTIGTMAGSIWKPQWDEQQQSLLLYKISDGYMDVTNAQTITGTKMFTDIGVTGSITDGTNSTTVSDLAALITYAKGQGWIS